MKKDKSIFLSFEAWEIFMQAKREWEAKNQKDVSASEFIVISFKAK